VSFFSFFDLVVLPGLDLAEKKLGLFGSTATFFSLPGS
jgi:hypothetical protein